MEYITLGSSGLQVSCLGFGGWQLGGHGWGDVDSTEASDAVAKARELGINFFDTANVYGLGQSEEQLSKALGDWRGEAIIATKFGVRWDDRGRIWKDISPDYIEQALVESLQRLRIDSIPLYYVHWPDGRTPIEDVIEVLERQRRRGNIQAIGLSNFSGQEVNRASQIAPIAALQLQYSLAERQFADGIVDEASQLGVPFVTWGSLAEGLLSGKYRSGTRFNKTDHRHNSERFQGPKFERSLKLVEQVEAVAHEIDRTPAQVAIRWLIQSPNVASVLVGAKRPSQVLENAVAVDFELGTEHYEMLDQASAALGFAEPVLDRSVA